MRCVELMYLTLDGHTGYIASVRPFGVIHHQAGICEPG